MVLANPTYVKPAGRSPESPHSWQATSHTHEHESIDGAAVKVAGDKVSLKIWRTICEASRKEFDAIYARLAE